MQEMKGMLHSTKGIGRLRLKNMFTRTESEFFAEKSSA
jgi:hypothetical protein